MLRIHTKLNVAIQLVVCTSLVVFSGCRTTNLNDPSYGIDRLPPVYENMPRELSKVVLPEYVIEPPDILTIEGIHIIPKSPYKLKSLDALNIQVQGTLPNQELPTLFTVEPGGIVQLGVPFGAVKVAGMSVEEAEVAILERFKKHLQEPQVVVSLAQLAASQQLLGECLVQPDGPTTLGSYGSISVIGKTTTEAKTAIESHLSQWLDDPVISINVQAFNSKADYVVLQGAGLGDGVYRLPVTGNETVLDAIANIQGLEQVSSKKIWIARPTSDCSRVQILPVDWYAVTERASPETNYQILPGDRVFIAEDKLVAFDTRIAKLTAPLERIMGFVLLGTGTTTRLSGPVLRGGGNPNNNGI